MSDSQTLKIALVGCGGIAQAHWRGIQTHATQLVVSAVVDTDPDRAAAMAEQTGGRPFTSVEDALAAGDFAAVDIMLPHNQHEAAAVAAFAAGKHVVLEKPMSTNLASCAHSGRGRASRDGLYGGGTGPILARCPSSAAVDSRRCYRGDHHRSCLFRQPGTGNRAHPKPWRYELAQAGGGITIDGGAHWLRPLRMWLGEVAEVSAVTGRPLAEMEGESFMRALLRFDSGVVALFDTLYGGAVLGPSEEFRVTGTAGEIISERGYPGRLLLFNKAHPEGKVLKANLWDGDGRLAAFGYELADFAQAVLTGTPLAASPESSLGELRTALAIYRSAASKQWERVWD
ncbi:MAG: Gfo/Idh/MocA family oxidoreductase [Caldilineaceae bacterium]